MFVRARPRAAVGRRTVSARWCEKPSTIELYTSLPPADSSLAIAAERAAERAAARALYDSSADGAAENRHTPDALVALLLVRDG